MTIPHIIFAVLLILISALGVFVAFRAPASWTARDNFVGMCADADWQNPGYDGMLYFLSEEEQKEQGVK